MPQQINDLEDGALVRAKINAAITACEMILDPWALVANTSLTYTANQARTVTTATRILCFVGGHSYQVAASDATVFDLQTAGGVKVILLPDGDGWYNFDGMAPFKDGTTDNLAKLQKLLDTKPVAWGLGGREGPYVKFSAGDYYFSNTINLKCRVRFFGQGSGTAETRSTRFIFPPSTAGIVINRHNTLGVATVAADSGSADGSELRGLQLLGGRGAAFDETKSGIWFRARAVLEDFSCRDFAGHGVFVAAAFDANPWLGNANLTRVKRGYIATCRGSALYIDGTDTNAGSFEQIDGYYCDGWCVYDSSFLGNTHKGHHSYSCAGGGYFCDNTTSVNIGSYVEDGVGDTWQWAGIAIGGTVYDVANSTGPALTPLNINPVRALWNLTGGYRAQHAFGSSDLGAEENSIIAARHTGRGPVGDIDAFRIRWDTDGTGVFVRWGNSANQLVRFNSGGSSWTFGRSTPVGESLNIRGYFLGIGNNARYRGTGTAAPTTGTWAQGDIIENINIASGQPMSWGCSVSGTPGTWIAGPNWP